MAGTETGAGRGRPDRASDEDAGQDTTTLPTEGEQQRHAEAAEPAESETEEAGGRSGSDDHPSSVERLREARQAPWQRVSKRVIGYGGLILFAFVFISPFVIAIVNSFKTRPQAANAPLSLVPDPFTTSGYDRLFQEGFWRAAFVTGVVVVCVTFGRVFLNSLAGYALARLDFPGRRVVFAIVVATLAIPAIVLAIPRFLVLGQLGLLNTWGGLILPLAADAFGIFLMKQFFESIPVEMEEAAKVDGASIFQMYRRVVLPMATPALIALTILSFQGAWNELLAYLIAAPSNPDLQTLTVFLAIVRGTVGEARDFPLELAGSILTTLPVAIVFFIFQRYFVQGVAATGVKG